MAEGAGGGSIDAKLSSRKRKLRDAAEEPKQKKSKRVASSQDSPADTSKNASKKRKIKKAEEYAGIDHPSAIGEPASPTTTTSAGAAADSRSAKKSKERKGKHQTMSTDIDDTSTKPSAEKEFPDGVEQNSTSKNNRFIVFVGNLPYTATIASLESHFSSLKPTSVRHITQKDDPTKSKGFAFLEFTDEKRMRTCLTQFHHSQFDDGKSPARRINVELTAGGGGRSKQRRQKLKVKNERLGTQRRRRQHEQMSREAKPKRHGNGVREDHGDVSTGKQKAARAAVPLAEDDIHPSRRAMIKG